MDRGSARAAASETAPRIPDQPSTAFQRQNGRGSWTRTQPLSAGGTIAVAMIQAKRAAITTPETNSA